MTQVPPTAILGNAVTFKPPIWNKGILFKETWCGPVSGSLAVDEIVNSNIPWVIITPLGIPVVPDEYISKH